LNAEAITIYGDSRFIIKYLGSPPERQSDLEQKKPGGYKALSVMEGQLRERDYVTGDAFTIADIALYAYTRVADEGGFSLDGYPAVTAWLDRIRSRPDYVPM